MERRHARKRPGHSEGEGVDRIVSARVEQQRWYLRHPRAVPAAIFALSMMATLLGVFASERTESRRVEGQMHGVAATIVASLERRVALQTAYLRAASIAMAAPGTMTKTRFKTFADELLSDDADRSHDGLSWSSLVPVAGIPAFEAARHADGEPGYKVHPTPPPGAVFVVPVTFVGGHPGAERVELGFDLNSEPVRRAGLWAAARSGRPTAAARVLLRGSPAGVTRPGLPIFTPVYALGTRRLTGFVGTPFNARAFLGAVVAQGQNQELAVRLYDGPPRPETLLAQVGRDTSGSGAWSHHSYQQPVRVANRQLTLVVEPVDQSLLSPISVLTLVLGLMVAGLLMAMARLATRQAAEDRASMAWLREQSSIRNMLTRELNHRVKNTLANVLSIVALTRRRATELDAFADSLEGRIRALSATHDLLTEGNWGPTPLRAVIEVELAPYARGPECSVDLDGPETDLAPNDALSLGLAIHELATNANKYGALSVIGGRVEVRWTRVSPSLLHLTWQERGGPPVSPPARRGFGTELIERIVAHELGHKVDLRFDPQGVYCELAVPVRAPAAFLIRGPRRPPA